MSDDFIYSEYLQDESICDELIEYFKKYNTKQPGRSGGRVNIIDKDSTDIGIQVADAVNHPVLSRYLEALDKVCDGFKKKYVYCNERMNRWAIVEGFNIQHYKPGQGYHAWHSERTGSNVQDISRMLVFMTYLNDVNDGGETHFYYQGRKIVPRKGLTLIWPADWTHTHKGIVSMTEEKYILTGWFSYTALL
jgi:hypothetical protein